MVGHLKTRTFLTIGFSVVMERLPFGVTQFLFLLLSLLNCGCSNNEPAPVDCSISDLTMDAVGANPTSCAANDGSIAAAATGGLEPYKFALNSGSFSTASTFIGLGGGSYTVRVKDKNGCESTFSVILVIPGDNPLNATASSTADTECLNNNGTIEVTASGGTAPYEYRVGAGSFSDVPTFNNLAPGNYSVAVRDDAGCIFTKSVTIAKGDSQTSLSADVEPIIDTECAITSCHNGSESPDLRTASAIITHASQIKSVTQSGFMPRNGSLTSSQKALIGCWVDEGAKNN